LGLYVSTMRRIVSLLCLSATSLFAQQGQAPVSADLFNILTNMQAAPPPVYIPVTVAPGVTAPQTLTIQDPLNPDAIALTNSLRTTNRPSVWRPSPIFVPQGQDLVANQLRQPAAITPPQPASFAPGNLITNAAPATPAPASPVISTNRPPPRDPWRQQNPLLRDLYYKW